MEHIRYRVGLGERVLFWHDEWVGDWPLPLQLPEISIVPNKDTRI